MINQRNSLIKRTVNVAFLILLGSVVIVFALHFILGTPYQQLPQPISYEQYEHGESANTATTTPEKPPQEVPVIKPGPTPTSTATSTQPLPPIVRQQMNLRIPFQSQAPFGDWSQPYEDGCEEASLIMVDHYFKGEPLTPLAMKNGIDTQVDWQFANWGGHENLSAAKLVELADVFYHYHARIIEPLTAQEIREQISLGNPVIIGAAGRELGNPHYHYPGPLYHMLIIKGFTADGKFITNDPGTRFGADYVYDENTLMSALHDWTGSEPDGPPVGVVLYP